MKVLIKTYDGSFYSFEREDVHFFSTDDLHMLKDVALTLSMLDCYKASRLEFIDDFSEFDKFMECE